MHPPLIKPGDHLKTRRFGYWHHGIHVGDGWVVHFAGDRAKDVATAKIRVGTFGEFAAGHEVRVVSYGRCHDAETVVKRALSLVGRTGYDVFNNNCEHAARWCKGADQWRSPEVERAISVVATPAFGSLAAALGVAGVGAAGASYYGAVQTTAGLAAIGRPLGLGAAQTVAFLGLLPTVLFVPLVRRAFKDDPNADAQERAARRAARTAAPLVAITSGIAMVGVISACGVVKGLSGPGITSGLASIGRLVGGRMAAGKFLSLLMPTVTTFGLVWLIYKLAQGPAQTVPQPVPASS
jgi:Lecithin retinol acyltransferase